MQKWRKRFENQSENGNTNFWNNATNKVALAVRRKGMLCAPMVVAFTGYQLVFQLLSHVDLSELESKSVFVFLIKLALFQRYKNITAPISSIGEADPRMRHYFLTVGFVL